MGGGSRGGAGFSPRDPNDIFASLFGASSAFTDSKEDYADNGAEGLGGGMGGGMPKGGRGMPNMGRSAGGFPGGGASFGGMDLDSDDDDVGHGFPGGFGSAGRSRAAKEEPVASELVKPLPLSLEDIYNGATKKMKIRRKKLDGTEEPKIIEIHVTKGKFPLKLPVQ